MPGRSNFEDKKARITLELPEPDTEVYEKYTDNFDIEEVEEKIGLETEEEDQPTVLVLEDFFLSAISESYPERTQIIETNEFPIMFGFGEGARIFQFEISVFDDKDREDFDWLTFLKKFHRICKATTIIDYNLDFRIQYNQEEFKGVWFNMNFQKNSQRDKVVLGNFKFFVLKEKQLPTIGEEEDTGMVGQTTPTPMMQ